MSPQTEPVVLQGQGVTRAGTIAVVGRPNVGKSTLLNRLVGEKISITSRKAQTTRQRVRGILTQGPTQFVFVDTPGFQTAHQNALNREMNRAVRAALAEVDVVLWVIEARQFTAADRSLLPLLPQDRPVLLVLNKADTVAGQRPLLPLVAELAKLRTFNAILPVSASRGQGIDALLLELSKLLPESGPLYAPEDLTDRDERFLAAEFIREKIFRLLGDELPYFSNVVIDHFEQEGELRRIFAAVIVDKPGQKPILLGKDGAMIKRIATEARQDMERLFGGRVYLEVWVRVKSGWADDEAALRRQGF
ncbi:GTPase Era [Burkholderiales bacterium]|nr:MAG: GTPase Era [Burkholderiales bacterium]CAG1010588.1 GTPase Era [Burkholderiales bacterium]